MEQVTIHEVGPRDGLQNEARPVSVAQRVTFIEALAAAGLPFIEVGSFVSPKWVPQMADTDLVMAGLSAGPIYEVLVPNAKGWTGFAAAKRSGRYQIAVFVSASEGFSRANLNCDIAESVERAAPVVMAARDSGVSVRGYVSCVTDCPFDGPTAPEAVADVAQRLTALGVAEVSLGETIGEGTPDRVGRMLEAVQAWVPVERLAGHFHDTGGRALDNIGVALEAGLRVFDSSAGGLGGCPYAPGAPGNVATEAVVDFLETRGFRTGVDRDKLAKAVEIAQELRS